MPDLIRLVHGSRNGVKKLIKEFRMYWKIKTSSDKTPSLSEECMEVEEGSGSSGDKTPPKSLESNADKSGDNVTDNSLTPGSNKNAFKDLEFSISNRQLELKIPSIAVREKRGDVKICWYVNADVLKQYNLEDLSLANTWEYLTQPQPVTVTPKTEEPSTGRATPNIMQFAQPMSLSQIQAAGTISIAKDLTPSKAVKEPKVENKMEVENSTTENPPVVKQPNDQKSIMQFMKLANSANKTTEKSPVIPIQSGASKMEDGDKKSLVIIEDDVPTSCSQTKPGQDATLKTNLMMSPGIKRINPIPVDSSSPSVKRITPVKLSGKSEFQEIRVKPIAQDSKNSKLNIRRITPVKVSSPAQLKTGGNTVTEKMNPVIKMETEELKIQDKNKENENARAMDIDVIILD